MAGKQGRKKKVGSRRPGATAKPAAAPSCKYYMSKESVQAVLNNKYVPVDLGEHFDMMDPDAQWLMLEVAAEHEVIEKRYTMYQARVRKEYNAKGFVALPDDVLERIARVNAMSSKIFAEAESK